MLRSGSGVVAGVSRLISFSKVDIIIRTTGTWEVPVVVLVSVFKNKIKPVWPSSEFSSVKRTISQVILRLHSKFYEVHTSDSKIFLFLLVFPQICGFSEPDERGGAYNLLCARN